PLLSSALASSTGSSSTPRAPTRPCSTHSPTSSLTSVMMPISLSVALATPPGSASARRWGRGLRFAGSREIHLGVDEANSAAQVVVDGLEDLGLPEPGRPGLVDAFLDERREELEPRRPRPGADDLEQMVLDL